ncbi:hypothetical protein BSKO_02177 [Bryopsis sp. KO-2023]|nr:hypothetical protein BSKO_02177 [Bryopsis sp. KO-2023]
MKSNEDAQRPLPGVNEVASSGEVFEEVDLEAGRPDTSRELLDDQAGVGARVGSSSAPCWFFAVGSSSAPCEEASVADCRICLLTDDSDDMVAPCWFFAVGSSSAPCEEASVADCRICLLTDDSDDMVAPCGCEGTLRFCHYKCLEQWAQESRALKCEICNQTYRQPYRARLMDTIAKAELSMQERRDAELAAQLGGEPALVQVPQENGSGSQAKKLWCRMLVVIALTITLLYVILFTLRAPHFSSWTIMVLRILSFILPFYLVGRAIVALQRYRQERQFAFA